MGKSKDLATGASYVDISGDTMTGSLTGTSAGFTGDVNIGNNASSNPLSKLRLGGTQYGASDIRPTDEGGHKVGMAFYTDGTGDTTIDPVLRMTIDSSGRVTTPSQPAFYAYTTNDNQNSGTYLTSSSSSTNWAESFDNGSNFSDGVFTAPVAGKYYFSVMWNRRDVQSRIAIRKNNSNYIRWEPTGRTDDAWESQQYSVLINLAANDYVNLYLEYSGTSNAAQNYPAHMGTGAWGHFAGYLIG